MRTVTIIFVTYWAHNGLWRSIYNLCGGLHHAGYHNEPLSPVKRRYFLLSLHTQRVACIETSCDSSTFTFETYYSNFIARQLYAQKYLKYKKRQYLHWSALHGAIYCRLSPTQDRQFYLLKGNNCRIYFPEVGYMLGIAQSYMVMIL